jgi:hypothetical protein
VSEDLPQKKRKTFRARRRTMRIFIFDTRGFSGHPQSRETLKQIFLSTDDTDFTD